MAKPIELMPKPSGQGAREELQRRLDAAPVEHAEAVLAGYELLQELHESGTLDVLRGLLGAGDQVVRHAVALAIQPEAVNGLRNLLVLSKVLGSVNPDVLHSAFDGVPDCIGCPAGRGSAVALRALPAPVFGGEPPRFGGSGDGARKRGQGTGRGLKNGSDQALRVFFAAVPVDSRTISSGCITISAGASFWGCRNQVQQHLRALAAHLAQRLAHRGDARLLIRGADDVVESHNRDVFGNPQSRIVDGANHADGGDVVEAEDRREVASPRQQFTHRLVSHLRRPAVGGKLNAQLRMHLDPQAYAPSAEWLASGIRYPE